MAARISFFPPAGVLRLCGGGLAVVILALSLAAPAQSQDWVYTTRPGDNLWNLSQEYLKNVGYWRRLQAFNQITDPHHILPGTRIRMPIKWLRQQPVPARITEVLGTATLTRVAGAPGEALSVGTLLEVGNSVVTGVESNVTVEFADGSRLVVQAQTELLMDTLSAYGKTGMVDTRVRLQRGRVESEVSPSKGPGSRFHIITPAAVAAARGTNFRVGADETTEVSRSEVLEGRVGVRGAGRTRDVASGFGTLVEAGRPPKPPVKLLPPPDVSGLPRLIDRLLMVFEWPSLEGAVAYRAQVFASVRFDKLLLDKLVTQPRVEFNAPPDDEYVLRLRAVDTLGLEGLNADHEFRIDARPVPPTLLEPPDGTAMHGKTPELWWSEPEGSRSFHLQVARDPEFADLLLDEPDTSKSRLRLKAEPPPGEYYWRVASVAKSGEKGPFGDGASFRIRVVPATVAAEETGVEETELRFAWGPAADADRYEFQFAHDDEFEDLIVDEAIEDTALSIERPKSGKYYFRVRAVSAEGVPGPYSSVNKVEVPSNRWWPMLLLLLLPLILL